ncbi:MAG TPA: DUF262 domain-containing protein [Pyrinomonadaceae bacterium]|jgi:hypothetical protein
MSTEIVRRDVEETEEMLDYSEPDPIEFWEQKQRELIVSVVDYNLSTLADLVSNRTIDTSPRFQRRFRWDQKRQSTLIESFLMNVPVPPIFLNEDEYGKYSVIDGKQRLTAITDFLAGRLELSGLEIYKELNGKTFSDLPPKLQSVMRTRPTLRATIILRQSDPDIKYEVFHRLNTGGVKLNPQEIRNSAFPGPFNDLLWELSDSKHFHQLLGIKNRRKSVLYKEMRDIEFVLRYFTFKEHWQDFTGSMKRLMDRYMDNNKDIPLHQVNELKDDFRHTLELVDEAFGQYAFKRWQPEKGQWRSVVLAALYDAQMIGVREFKLNQLMGKQDQITEGLKSLFQNEEFRKSIDAATNTVVNFRTRVEMIREMIWRIV